MKRFVTLLLVVSLFCCLALAGCNSQEKASNDSKDTNDKASNEEDAQKNGNEDVEEKEKEPVKLVNWMPGSDDYTKEAFEEIYTMMPEECSNVTVEFQQVPWSEYFTKLNVALAGGMGPDVFGLGFGQLGPVQSAGNLLALNDYLEGWDGWEDISDNILSSATKDEQLYALLLPECRPFVYRKDLFKAAGLTEPPKTVEELKRYAEKLTQKDGDKVTLAGLETPTSNGEQLLFAFILMSGITDQLWDEECQPVYDDEKIIELVEGIYSYFEDGIAMYSDQHDIQGTLFENGLAAMSVTTSTNSLIAVREKLGEDKFAIALPPNEMAPALGSFMCVNSKSENPEEAVELFKSITSKEGMLTMAKKIGFVPTRKSCSDDYIALNPDINELVVEAIGKAKTYGGINPYFFDYLEALRPALEKVYYGKETAEVALTKAAEDYRAKLNQ